MSIGTLIQTIYIWGVSKIMGTFLGVSKIRTIVYWGLYWGPLILRNYHMEPYRVPWLAEAPVRQGMLG